MPVKKDYKYCLIYCRVSSVRQVVDGNGLGSQEQRCRERAASHDYVVEKVFGDEGISGSLFDRPAMAALIDYLDAHPNRQYVVIFDDLKRFARDYLVHLKIKSELISRGVKLECLNFNFEDSEESEFIEGVLALQAQLERKQNRRQVIQKQKARLERGFWPFCPPLGFKHIRSQGDGKVLVPREPFASIYKEALEGYANNSLITQDDTKLFIMQKYREHGLTRPISLHGVQETLKNPLYAGLVEYKPWEVDRMVGRHEGIISKETFENVQTKLASRTKILCRKDYRLDFPLRGWARCAGCGHAFTASWVGGRSRHYPTYNCNTPGCRYRYKSIQKGKIEPEFETLLLSAKMESGAAQLAKAIFMDAWSHQKEVAERETQLVELKLRESDQQISSLVQRVSSTQNPTLISAYEAEIQKISTKREEFQGISQKPQFSDEQFGTALDKVIKTLENPLQLWKSDSIDDKRTIQLMYFDQPPCYSYEKGFGTVEFSQAIKLFSLNSTPDVEMGGFEPPSATAAQHHLQT